MLTVEENELLTRVGPGTPMGDYMRRFWHPALLASELPGPDCPPVRLRLLGEDLVAFRDSNGKVGVLQAYCPHRGAPLFFGRNEDCGLRCVYHGWKFDVEGACVDTPNVSGDRFKDKVEITAYAARESARVIWVYMGPPELQPVLPEYEINLVPDDHVFAHKRIQECNYLQILEGEMDSSHVSFLHRRMDDFFGPGVNQHPMFTDTAPKFDIVPTAYGQMVGAQRQAGPDMEFWRVTQLLLPTTVLVGVLPGSFMTFSSSVPMDDENTIGFSVAWRPDRPLDSADMELIDSGLYDYPSVDPATFIPLRNKRNDYMIDREAQRTSSYTGITGIREQDAAVVDMQGGGRILDRSKELLCASDTALVKMRRRLLQGVRELADGVEPTEPQRPEAYRVRATNTIIPKGVSWIDATRPDVLGLGATEVAILAAS